MSEETLIRFLNQQILELREQRAALMKEIEDLKRDLACALSKVVMQDRKEMEDVPKN